MGQGKSTLLNKIAWMENLQANENAKYDKEFFRCGKDTGSVTTKVIHKQIGHLLLNDSPGFDDPTISDLKLWNRTISNLVSGDLKVNMETHGISTVILPLMMDKGHRIKASQIVIVYQALMLFTVIFPNFKLNENTKIPNF